MLAPEEMVWLTRYVACALPVMGLLNILVRRDAVSLCFGFALFLLNPVLLAAVASVQNGGPDALIVGLCGTFCLALLPAIFLRTLFQMKQEDV